MPQLNTGEWIGAVAVVVSLGQLILAWRADHARRVAEGRVKGAGRRNIAGIQFEWPVPLWAIRLGIFVIQTTAVYFLVREYNSVEPITRGNVIFIAAMIGVITVCFVIPLINNVYIAMETYGGRE